ncbi:hypothetical protein TNCV_1826021 [Trichonephila clavipes]|nr:hypothetical protein TNCV_1826021 [Trichonephila clavipes]
MRVAASRFVERNSRKDPQIRPPRRPPTGERDRLAVPFLHRSFYRRLRRAASQLSPKSKFPTSRQEDHLKPRLPDLLATTNSLHATPHTVKLHQTPSPSSDFHNMGLRTVFTVEMPKDKLPPTAALLSASFPSTRTVRYVIKIIQQIQQNPSKNKKWG